MPDLEAGGIYTFRAGTNCLLTLRVPLLVCVCVCLSVCLSVCVSVCASLVAHASHLFAGVFVCVRARVPPPRTFRNTRAHICNRAMLYTSICLSHSLLRARAHAEGESLLSLARSAAHSLHRCIARARARTRSLSVTVQGCPCGPCGAGEQSWAREGEGEGGGGRGIQYVTAKWKPAKWKPS